MKTFYGPQCLCENQNLSRLLKQNGYPFPRPNWNENHTLTGEGSYSLSQLKGVPPFPPLPEWPVVVKRDSTAVPVFA